jgi:hypothetical protein
MIDSQPEGIGILKYHDGQTYHGSFKEGKSHGAGTLRKNLYEYKGEWNMGSFQGQGKLIDKELEYIGLFKDNKFHGMGFLKNNKR